MKEDLIKVLNFKLKSITNNIENLNDVNNRIDDENVHLKYIQDAINNFKSEEPGFDIYKFVKIDREMFNKLLMELDDSVLKIFGTNSCNYEGLVYLINGINNGISLSLTQEQASAINLLIDKLLEKEKVYQDKISALNVEKQKLEITDLDVLKGLERKYTLIIEEFDDQKYVLDIDSLIEAIVYADLSKEKTFDLLCYLLSYNASIYEKEKESKKDSFVQELPRKEETIDLTVPFELDEEKNSEEDENEEVVSIPINEENEIANRFASDLSISDSEDVFDKTIKLPAFNYVSNNALPEETEEGPFLTGIQGEPTEEDVEEDENDMEISIPVQEESVEDQADVTAENEVYLENANNSSLVDEDFNDLDDEDFDDYNPVLPPLDANVIDLNEIELDKMTLPHDENVTEIDQTDIAIETPSSDALTFENSSVVETEPTVSVAPLTSIEQTAQEVAQEVPSEPVASSEPAVAPQPIVEATPVQEVALNVAPPVVETPKLNEEDVKKVFSDFNFKYEEFDDVTKDLLLKGNLDDYRNMLNKLKELNVLAIFEKNLETLSQLMMYSSVDVINEVVALIGENLSVDEDDKKVTTNIVFKTMPSIFVKNDNGNYSNFVENIKSFKEYGIDLINLFDFSREVFVADHELIVNNYNTVRGYDLTVNDHNAKYLLLLPNITEKLDYYVEAIYKDTMKGGKGEVFDGIDLIKLYPNKLNIVASETIKRLRYASLNGRKIFGSKEKSLSGEITNLKVDVINMPDDYLRTFFNDEFDIIPRSDVETYHKLVSNNDYVEPKIDELLNKLEAYRQGIRYTIEGVNVSRNKVIRNYNILINNGIGKTTALLFAICHNLVITKEEYEKIKNIVNGLGGN